MLKSLARQARRGLPAAALILTSCAIPGPTPRTDPMPPFPEISYQTRLTTSKADPRQPEHTLRALTPAHDPGPDAVRVILVHGTPGDATNWNALLARPPEGAEVIAIDRPGFGKTRPGRAVTSLRAQAAALAPLLEDPPNGIPPILVGHSYGGPVIAQAAADYPGMVGGLVMVAAALDPDLEKVLLIQKIGNLGLVRPALPRFLRNTNLELIALEAELRNLEPRLPSIDIPIEIVHGRRDTLVPYANVLYMERHFIAASLKTTTLDQGNHFLIWNEVETTRAAIERTIEAARREERLQKGLDFRAPTNTVPD